MVSESAALRHSEFNAPGVSPRSSALIMGLSRNTQIHDTQDRRGNRPLNYANTVHFEAQARVHEPEVDSPRSLSIPVTSPRTLQSFPSRRSLRIAGTPSP